MTPDMIIKIDADGNKLEGKLNPSSEIKMHMRVYRERPDVNAVVHAHPADRHRLRRGRHPAG